MFPRFTKVLLLLLLLQTSPAQAGWLSDHLKSASDAVFENDEGMNADTLLEEASVTIDAATGTLKEASTILKCFLLTLTFNQPICFYNVIIALCIKRHG